MTLSKKWKLVLFKVKRFFIKSEILYRIKYRTLSFIAFVLRPLIYKNTLFFDTNFIVSRDETLDRRHKKLLTWNKEHLVSESIRKEIDDKLLDTRFRLIYNKELKTIGFNDLQRAYPICCVYYNFIGTMHNPADINDLDFGLQMIYAKIIKKKPLSKDETVALMKLTDALIERCTAEHNIEGNPKSELEKVMDEANLRSLKKRKDSLKGKNINYPNDLRNLATVFVYSLIHKKNVTFVTADCDAVAYFFDWSSSLIQQMSFNTRYLELWEKDPRIKERFLKGRLEALFYDSLEMRRYMAGTTQRFYNNNTKFFSPRLTIKYWDKSRQKYFDFDINIDHSVRMLFLHAHGSLNCPTTANALLGSFIKYRYWWPPSSIHNKDILKVLPRLKPIHYRSAILPTHIHDLTCLYRKHDLAGDFSIFSSFT